jgi:hypothetical protein
MRYDFKGKKRKPLPRKSNKRKLSSKVTKATPSPRMQEIKAFNDKYPSYSGKAKASEPALVEDDSYKEEAKSKYTVAIAYNKGSYQIIPKEDLEHIGK